MTLKLLSYEPLNMTILVESTFDVEEFKSLVMEKVHYHVETGGKPIRLIFTTIGAIRQIVELIVHITRPPRGKEFESVVFESTIERKVAEYISTNFDYPITKGRWSTI